MSRDPLRTVVEAVQAANERFLRALEASRASWSDQTRAGFDRAFVEELVQSGRTTKDEIANLADAIRKEMNAIDT